MTEAIIYRVHRADCITVGMYRSVASNEFCDTTNTHPMPQDDEVLVQQIKDHGISDAGHIPYQYCFGFGSLDQLKKWVHKQEWMIALAKEKFFISAYRTTDFAIGDTQAIFRLKSAKFIETLDWPLTPTEEEAKLVTETGETT